MSETDELQRLLIALKTVLPSLVIGRFGVSRPDFARDSVQIVARGRVGRQPFTIRGAGPTLPAALVDAVDRSWLAKRIPESWVANVPPENPADAP